MGLGHRRELHQDCFAHAGRIDWLELIAEHYLAPSPECAAQVAVRINRLTYDVVTRCGGTRTTRDIVTWLREERGVRMAPAQLEAGCLDIPRMYELSIVSLEQAWAV